MIRAAILAALLAVTPAHATYIHSDEFLANCTAQAPERHIACVAYIAGVTDAYGDAHQFCIPPQVRPEEIAAFVIDYAVRTVSIRFETPANMIVLALKARWPCVSGGQFRFYMYR
jgi:hypothetical protein